MTCHYKETFFWRSEAQSCLHFINVKDNNLNTICKHPQVRSTYRSRLKSETDCPIKSRITLMELSAPLLSAISYMVKCTSFTSSLKLFWVTSWRQLPSHTEGIKAEILCWSMHNYYASTLFWGNIWICH